jgi:hypothetical protein
VFDGRGDVASVLEEDRPAASGPPKDGVSSRVGAQILTYGACDDTVIQALRQLPPVAERRATSPADRQAVGQVDAIIERAVIEVIEPAPSA